MAVFSFTRILVDSNLLLQRGKPMIHKLRGVCTDTIRACLSRYCRGDVLDDLDLEDCDIANIPKKQVSANVQFLFSLVL